MLIYAHKDHLAMQVAGLLKLEDVFARRNGPRSQQGICRVVADQGCVDVARAKRAPGLRIKEIRLHMPVLREFVLHA